MTIASRSKHLDALLRVDQNMFDLLEKHKVESNTTIKERIMNKLMRWERVQARLLKLLRP